MGHVLVWAFDADQAFELLVPARGLASGLGDQVAAAALGPAAARANEYGPRGADRVFANSDAALKELQVEPYTDALQALVAQVKPSVVLIGASIRARDVASRLATRLEVGLGSEQFNLRLDGGRLVGERLYFSGNSVLTEKLVKDPMVSLVTARAYEAAAPDASRSAPPEPFTFTPKAPKAVLAKSEKKPTGGVHLEDADVIVSVGRGLKKKEDLPLVQDLAQALGAAVGCTRPIAADLKWLGDENWIGLSGHEVKPKAYIGLGVSGQIQHVAGMRGSKIIVAINKDEEAPLVKISDYAIVDDLYKVVPALTKEIKRLRGG